MELHEACYTGNIYLVKDLVSKGFDVNAKCVNKATPLYMACRGGHLDVVKFLVEHGADVDGNTITFFQRIKRLFGYVPSDEFLHNIPIVIASTRGFTEIVKFLLKKGANVKRGCAVLFGAYYNGHKDIVKLLIKHGAIDYDECLFIHVYVMI